MDGVVATSQLTTAAAVGVRVGRRKIDQRNIQSHFLAVKLRSLRGRYLRRNGEGSRPLNGQLCSGSGHCDHGGAKPITVMNFSLTKVNSERELAPNFLFQSIMLDLGSESSLDEVLCLRKNSTNAKIY